MFETERLKVRKFNSADLPMLIEQRSDPEVNKYLGGTRLQNPEAIEKRLDFYISCYDRFGFGMCSMHWKANGAMIGASGLQPLEETGEIEIGYSLIKKFWGKGLATEAARAWLIYGFESSGLQRIVAVTQPANTASWRVMEKLGMIYEKTGKHYDLECLFYAVTRNQFLEKQRADGIM